MPTIDLNIQQSWASPIDVIEHLPAGWREYAYAHMAPAWQRFYANGGERPEGRPGSTILSLDAAYQNPFGDYVEGSVAPDAIAAGSDPELLRRHHLDPCGIDAALLCHGIGALVPSHGVARLSVELTRAINDLTVDRWLSSDDRLYGTVLVPTQVPEAAAAEIRRVGAHDRMRAVLLSVTGLGRPFGHPAYAPIFEAAHELELPVVIQAGGDLGMETATYPAAAGVPSTFAESRVLAPQALMTHAGSLIAQGVMDTYPSLRFLLLGGSVGWITPFLWRFDTDHKAFRHDVLWLKKPPSEVFRECFFVGTGPLKFDAAGDRFARYIAADHGLEDVLCYASGYPDRERDEPASVAAALPAGWEGKVMSENAERFLTGRRSAAPEPEAAVTTARGS
jgi:predicted TIM-barrel fold metal-dependent hydrolase